MAAFVEIDTGCTVDIGKDSLEYARSPFGCVQHLHKRQEHWNEHRDEDLAPGAHMAMQACCEHDSGFNGVDVQPRILTRKHQRCNDAALLRRGISIHPGLGGPTCFPFASQTCFGREVAATAKTRPHRRLALGIFRG